MERSDESSTTPPRVGASEGDVPSPSRPNVSFLMSQIQFVVDTNTRTMGFVDGVERQLAEYYRKLDEEKRREQEKVRAEFDELTETKRKWEHLVEMADLEIKEVRKRGNDLEKAYLLDTQTLLTFLRGEVEQKEARVSQLESCYAIK